MELSSQISFMTMWDALLQQYRIKYSYPRVFSFGNGSSLVSTTPEIFFSRRDGVQQFKLSPSTDYMIYTLPEEYHVFKFKDFEKKLIPLLVQDKWSD